MKLKFSADKKDWIMFGIYAAVLLYFVAIAVLNIAQFAAGDINHPFHGFNPFPAFSPNFFWVTIVLYIIALVASLLSVSDKFFDRSKGFGFSLEGKKTEKGYSRWANDSEMKSELKMVNVQAEKAEYGGVPLINNGRKMWVDAGEGHNIIVGSTGSGKTQAVIFPLVHSLAKHDESMIITDPKGEIYTKSSEMLRKKGYNVVLLNFRDPQRGSGWNPLYLPYKYFKAGNVDKANELTDDLAMNILYDENAQSQDPFWEKTSADYFSGICLGLFEDADEKEINLNSVNLFTTVGEEKCGPNTVYVNEYFKSKDPNSPAYISASSTITAPTDTKGSILSVFKQKIRLFAARENLSEMLSHSDFDFEDIGSKKTAVFIIVQDEKKTYHSLVTIFLKQCYESLVDFAQKNGGKLPYRTNFILDEFANMPPLKDVDAMVSAARSRKMRFYFVIQNYAQLAEVYGKEKGDTIRGNCTNIIYLISTEIAALEEISKMCGEYEIKEKDKDGKEKKETRPLITVSDLQRLSMWEIIVLRLRMNPFRTKIKPNFEIDWGPTEQDGNAEYPEREKEPVHIFDLKGFVNKKKEEKINDLINGNLGKETGAGSGMPNFPFPGMSGLPRPKSAPSGLNVDALVKRIDQRLAEIEAEEAKQKAIAKVDSKIEDKIIKQDVANDQLKQVSEVKPKQKIEKVQEEKIIPAKPKDERKINKQDLAAKITSKVNANAKKEKEVTTHMSNDHVSDDQFFDDFFNDDEEY